MKSAIVLAVVLTLGVVVLSLGGRYGMQQQLLLPVAFGVPGEGTMELHIGVDPAVVTADPLEVLPDDVRTWADWVRLHYQLYDATGLPVELRLKGTSDLLREQSASHAPDFVIWAELKTGETYHCDFVPLIARRTRYRYTFNVPPEPVRVARTPFQFYGELLVEAPAAGTNLTAENKN